MRLGKVWGCTELLLRTPLLEIHRLTILPNARCSMHSHAYKHNGFLVLSGRLKIETEKQDYPLTDATEIGPGEFTSVKPGEFHRFVSGDEPVIAVEMYYLEPLSEDIIRKDCGRVGVAGVEPDDENVSNP